MASLDSISPDQRAVLQLVLQQGRSYDEIATMLSIDRASVRQRALSAFDALGPQTGVDAQRRALITDYLLGQLPPAVAQETRARLASSPPDRAWARVVASELAPIAREPLPQIPSGSEQPAAPAPLAVAPATGGDEAPASLSASTPRSSRIGGLILIGIGVVAAIVVAVVLITNSGSSKSPASSSGTNKPAAAASSSSSSSSSTTASSSSAAHVVAQISLSSPKTGSKTAGIAEVLKEGANKGIAIVADHVTPNTTKPPDAYAVWLYNSSSDAQLLGFVNPGVGKNGRLSTAGGLPTNASHFHEVVITLETKADPKTPGTIVLHGPLSGLS